jgi:hypothetical protein
MHANTKGVLTVVWQLNVATKGDSARRQLGYNLRLSDKGANTHNVRRTLLHRLHECSHVRSQVYSGYR